MNLAKNETRAINDLKERLIALCPGQIKSITLFGSKARGEESPFADIDLLVVVTKESLELWDKIQSVSSEVSLDRDVLLSIKVMDSDHLSYLEKVESGFIKNVYKDGASIWKAA